MSTGDELTEFGAAAVDGSSRSLQISNAVGRVHKQLVGRGPSRVRTHISDDLVVCVLEGGFTRAERTLCSHAGKLPVIEIRLRLQDAMKDAIIEAVEEVVGRPVRSFMSSNDPVNDIQSEVMLLAPSE
jgi:uncharacterized protein YbcI